MQSMDRSKRNREAEKQKREEAGTYAVKEDAPAHYAVPNATPAMRLDAASKDAVWKKTDYYLQNGRRDDGSESRSKQVALHTKQ